MLQRHQAATLMRFKVLTMKGSAVAQPKKLSGAALAAELGVLPSFSGPQAATSSEAGPSRIQDAGAASIPTPDHVQARDAPALAPQEAPSSKKPQGGRPSKAGADGIPLNVRLSQGDHLALARLAGEMLIPGRPMPTVQDVVRGLIRGALQQPDTALGLIRRADMP